MVNIIKITEFEASELDIYARKKKMKLHIRQRAPVVNPEKKIRRKAILEKAIKNSESE